MKYIVVVEVPGQLGHWEAHLLKMVLQEALRVPRARALEGARVLAAGEIDKPLSCGKVILEVTEQPINSMRSLA